MAWNVSVQSAVCCELVHVPTKIQPVSKSMDVLTCNLNQLKGNDYTLLCVLWHVMHLDTNHRRGAIEAEHS